MSSIDVDSSLPEESRVFYDLDSLMGDKDHITGTSTHGKVRLVKTAGSIFVGITGRDESERSFDVYEDKGLRLGGNPPKGWPGHKADEALIPDERAKKLLDEVISSFREKGAN